MPINCIAKAKVVSFPPVANGLSFASKVLWGRSVAQSGAQFCAYRVYHIEMDETKLLQGVEKSNHFCELWCLGGLRGLDI